MTAYTQLLRKEYNSFNQKDCPPRRRRPDIAQRFVDAGFEMVDHNKFDLEVFGQSFKVRSSRNGRVVTGDCLDAPQVFSYTASPLEIATWCADLAESLVSEDWLTADLPPTEDHPLSDYPPYCYGV